MISPDTYFSCIPFDQPSLPLPSTSNQISTLVLATIESEFLDKVKAWNREEVRKYHEELKSNPKANRFFIWSFFSDGNLMPSMAGLKLIADSLVIRHKFEKDSLVVCSTLTEFREQLNLIANVQDDFCKAFIIPSHSSVWGKKQDGTIAKRLEELPQHILTVGIKKKGVEIHLAILDPIATGANATIESNHIGLDLEENIPFTPKELVLSYILDSKLSPKTTKIYYSIFPREFYNGCWSFALKDAVTFLKSPTFFEDIKLVKIEFSKKIKGFFMRGIAYLPSAFLIVTQIPKDSFENFFKAIPEKDHSYIKQKINKHLIEGMHLRIEHVIVKWMEQLRQTSLKLN